MTKSRTVKSAVLGAAVAASSVLGVAGVASASPRTSFTAAQQKLEAQLAARVTQLTKLSADVAAAKSLTGDHVTALTTDITNATTSINGLVTKVPTDTWAELRTDRATMILDNRVFAVLTPQVFQTIEADDVAVQVTTDQSNEATLQSSVNSLVGLPGYKNALNHYVAFIRAVGVASADATNVATSVLAQMPADYPGDTHVFVKANVNLLNAAYALARASYDSNIIGLASGGYTGS